MCNSASAILFDLHWVNDIYFTVLMDKIRFVFLQLSSMQRIVISRYGAYAQWWRNRVGQWPTHFFNCVGLAHPLLALLSFVFVLLITTDHQLFPGLAHPLSKSFRRRCLCLCYIYMLMRYHISYITKHTVVAWF